MNSNPAGLDTRFVRNFNGEVAAINPVSASIAATNTVAVAVAVDPVRTVAVLDGLASLIRDHVKAINALGVKLKHAEAKVEQYQTAIGQHVKAIKLVSPDDWENIVRAECNLGRSRAYELLAIADGTKTVEQVRAAGAKRVREHEERKKISRPLANGQPADNAGDPEASAAEMRAKFAATAASPKTAKRREPESKFDDKDVAKGKELVAQLLSWDKAVELTEIELGKLADGLKPIYGDKTLARFAEAIGLSADRLNRCRSVHRAYKDKEIKGPAPKFGVLQALQGHPDREEILANNPKLTKRQARSFMQALRLGQGKEQNWQVEEARRWFAAVENRAVQNIKDGHPAKKYMDRAVLRPAIDDVDKYVATLRGGAKGLTTLADTVERLLTTPDQTT